VNDKWQSILANLRQANKMVEALMRSVRLVGVEGSSVIVEAPSDLLKGRIEQPSSKSPVEQSISQVMGVPVRRRCVAKGEYQVRTVAPASPQGASAASELHQAEPSSIRESAPGDVGKRNAGEDAMLEEALRLGAEVKNVD
jgi:hypothetical protein